MNTALGVMTTMKNTISQIRKISYMMSKKL